MAEKKPQVADSPIADVFEGRHPSPSEKEWAEKTLAPTLEKNPEKPIGAATGVNVDEHGNARYTTLSGVPINRLYTQADLPEDWKYEEYLGYPGQPPYHARHSLHRISRQALHHAPVFRLRLAGGDQPALQVFARTRRQRIVSGVRFADVDGLRLRPCRPAKGKWASAAWPSIRSRTWKSCSTASTWRRRRSR